MMELKGKSLVIDINNAAELLRAMADVIEAAGMVARDEEFWRKVALDAPSAEEPKGGED